MFFKINIPANLIFNTPNETTPLSNNCLKPAIITKNTIESLKLLDDNNTNRLRVKSFLVNENISDEPAIKAHTKM